MHEQTWTTMATRRLVCTPVSNVWVISYMDKDLSWKAAEEYVWTIEFPYVFPTWLINYSLGFVCKIQAVTLH